MSREVDWEGWPEESWDDPECDCKFIENHTYCRIHGMWMDTGKWRTPEEYIAKAVARRLQGKGALNA